MPKYITLEGLEKIKKELDYLKTTKRKEVADKIGYAASFGDLSENAAYQRAKEDQGFLEGKILELEEIVRSAKIIEKPKQTDRVQIGSIILIDSGDKTEKFQVVGTEEANPMEGKISYQSPLGQALMDKKAGAKIKIDTPDGKIQYKIIKID